VKALTVRQPWAWAIVHGGKDVENRVWSTSYRDTLAIHAGLEHAGDEAFEAVAKLADMPPLLNLGMVVGIVELVDVHEASAEVEVEPGLVAAACCKSPWAQSDGWYHWVLSDPKPLRPKRRKGALGLWAVDWAEIRDAP
jgi:hypothetical protein